MIPDLIEGLYKFDTVMIIIFFLMSNHNSFQNLHCVKSLSNFIESAESYPLTLAHASLNKFSHFSVFKKNKSIIQSFQAKKSCFTRNNSNGKFSTSEESPEDQKVSDQKKPSMTLKEKMALYREKIQQNQRRLQNLKKSRIVPKQTQNILTQLNSPKKVLKKNSLNQQEKVFLEKECSELFRSQDLKNLFLLKKNSTQTKTKNTAKYEVLNLQIQGKKQKFIILKYLDKGSFGMVHLVKHQNTGIILCIKTIVKSSLNEESLKNLIQEIKVQSSLNHPNILNLYGCTADAENVYLLLEPCLGSNAYKKLTKEKVPEKDVRKYIKEICSAVDYLHKKDIIHRDIKAENILFHEDTAKLCDFGWAVHAPMLRNTQCGTPLYCPPEIIKNESYNSKVDIWCIGVLTYEMLYGTSPFQIRHQSELSKIVEEDVFFSQETHISEAASNFIQRCLTKEPSIRLNIRQALQHEFLMTKLEVFRHTFA